MLIFSAIILYVLASIVYVYKFRGNTRYEGFGQYIRKGWPLFTPINVFLYLFTRRRARHSIMNIDDFPELNILNENWQLIQQEALALMESGSIDKTADPESSSYYDIGFRTFYKYGWRKFYISWYGYNHQSAERLCPKTCELIRQIPIVNGAMFSLLPPGGKLTRHLDPLACSLRYHMGLKTPNDSNCFINVDGENYSWRDGESFMFDETYLHYVNNNTDSSRLILMCDVKRPTHTLGTILNFFLKLWMRWSIVPNTDEDKRGLANKVFGFMAPINKRTRKLKTTNRALYKLIKYTVNGTCFLILAGLIYAIIELITKLL